LAIVAPSTALATMTGHVAGERGGGDVRPSGGGCHEEETHASCVALAVLEIRVDPRVVAVEERTDITDGYAIRIRILFYFLQKCAKIKRLTDCTLFRKCQKCAPESALPKRTLSLKSLPLVWVYQDHEEGMRWKHGWQGYDLVRARLVRNPALAHPTPRGGSRSCATAQLQHKRHAGLLQQTEELVVAQAQQRRRPHGVHRLHRPHVLREIDLHLDGGGSRGEGALAT